MFHQLCYNPLVNIYFSAVLTAWGTNSYFIFTSIVFEFHSP